MCDLQYLPARFAGSVHLSTQSVSQFSESYLPCVISPVWAQSRYLLRLEGQKKKPFYFSLIRLRIRSGEVEHRQAMDLSFQLYFSEVKT